MLGPVQYTRRRHLGPQICTVNPPLPWQPATHNTQLNLSGHKLPSDTLQSSYAVSCHTVYGSVPHTHSHSVVYTHKINGDNFLQAAFQFCSMGISPPGGERCCYLPVYRHRFMYCRHDVNGASSWYFLRHVMVRRCNNQKRREENYT